jgi:hypothetical protein
MKNFGQVEGETLLRSTRGNQGLPFARNAQVAVAITMYHTQVAAQQKTWRNVPPYYVVYTLSAIHE